MKRTAFIEPHEARIAPAIVVSASNPKVAVNLGSVSLSSPTDYDVTLRRV